MQGHDLECEVTDVGQVRRQILGLLQRGRREVVPDITGRRYILHRRNKMHQLSASTTDESNDSDVVWLQPRLRGSAGCSRDQRDAVNWKQIENNGRYNSVHGMRMGANILVSLYIVCLSVCQLAYLINHMAELYQTVSIC